jgi:hypothetical protein
MNVGEEKVVEPGDDESKAVAESENDEVILEHRNPWSHLHINPCYTHTHRLTSPMSTLAFQLNASVSSSYRGLFFWDLLGFFNKSSYILK